jgi:hypothetical protein
MGRDQLLKAGWVPFATRCRFLGRPTIVIGEKLTAINVPGDWAANRMLRQWRIIVSKYATDFST